MSPAVRKILIMVVAAGVIIPATYLLYTQLSASQTQADPFSYVPSNSSLVVEGHYNSTQIYAFSSNGSFGMLLPFTVNELELLSNATTPTNGTSLTVSHYSTFMSQDIYSVKNLNLTAITSLFGYSSSSIMNYAMQILNLSNTTFFASDAGTYGMVLGNITGVQQSITSYSKGQTFSSYATGYLDSTSNLSFYYRPYNLSSVTLVTGNFSSGNSNIHIGLSNGTSLGSYTLEKNGSVNISLSTSPGNIYVSITGNYTLGQLFKYASPYLKKAGL